MKKLLSLLFMAFIPIVMMAYDVEVNGIYYNLNTSANTASVTSENSSDYNSYSGDVVIPETIAYNGVTYQVTSIEDYAFYLCSDLTSISIPNNVVSIGECAFDGCTSLPVEDNIMYAGPYLVGPVDREQTTYTIKAGTKYIGTGAFSGCTNMTSINIPETVISIGKFAFQGCYNLPVENNIIYAGPYLVEAVDKSQTTYTIKEGTKYIGQQSFTGCDNLASIIIPSSVTRIEDYAFENCHSLSSVTISEGVKEIDYGAFYCCCSLTSINIPSSVTRIEYAAFMKLGLTSITVASENTIYDSRNNCNAIIETSSNTLIAGCGNTVIPESVTSIGVSAFQDCTNLTSITIPKNVTKIGYLAISIDPWIVPSCFTTVVCEATIPPMCEENSPFSDVSNVTLYVPAASIDAYKAADFWKDFGTITTLSTIVTANSYTREYGDENPSFEWTEVGLPLDGTPTISCSATKTSAPDNYDIVITRGTETNTDVTYVNGTLTVTKAPLTITANNYTIKEGDALPAFDAVFTGLKNGESESVVNPAITCTSTDSNTPGTYDINVTATSDNYDITIVKGTLTILPTDVTITITSAGMATYCSPYDLDFSNVTGLKAYTITGYDRASQKVYAMRVYDVPAGTGLYLVGNQGDYTVNVGSSSSYYINMLVGTLAETWIEPTDGEYTNFRLTGTSPTNASFKALTQGRNFSANRAYLQIPTAVYNGTANAVGIIFDDEADGIENISMEDAGTDWFTLDGRKLNGKPTTKGIYVVNGRKVVIK